MKKLIATLAMISAALSAAEAKPRVVSLDYCSDQYLLKLADPDQILAVSRGGDNDYSYMREAAAPHRKIRASIEEALALEPDIVLRQWGGGADADKSFSRFGAHTVSLGYSTDFDGVIENIILVATALEQQERGEALVHELENKLASLPLAGASAINALYVTPGGVTAGANTMVHTIMETAGVTNITAAAGKSYWPPLPAETLLLEPPQLIVAGFFASDDEHINYWSAARHPAIEKQLRTTPTIHLPTDTLSCAAWFAADASILIARKAQEILDAR